MAAPVLRDRGHEFESPFGVKCRNCKVSWTPYGDMGPCRPAEDRHNDGPAFEQLALL